MTADSDLPWYFGTADKTMAGQVDVTKLSEHVSVSFGPSMRMGAVSKRRAAQRMRLDDAHRLVRMMTAREAVERYGLPVSRAVAMAERVYMRALWAARLANLINGAW